MTSSPNHPLLQLRALAAGYGAMTVVHDVHLDVHQGESVGIHGPNGAGKTTLLNTVAGAQRVHGGSVALDGRALGHQPAHKRVAAGLALVPAGRQIITSLSTRANLDITLLSRGRARRDDEHQHRLGKVLEIFPMLERCMDRPGGLLSGGQQQMLAVARALMTAPRVLLLDEPTQGLAEIIVDDFVRVLNTLRRQGMALVIVEQRSDFLDAVTDRTMPLKMGRLEQPTSP